MCGLIGIAGKLQYKDEATMKRLFLLDFFRGPDSTGLAAIRGNGDCRLVKLPSHPLDLFDSSKFKEALNGMQSTVFIGHNRAATRGVVSHGNAHPYQFDHIIGAHNGTLTTESHKELEKLAVEKFPVDSQALFAAISRVGIEETMKAMETGSSMSTGAWSLVWYDQKQSTLNFLRNKWRPMWYAFNEEFDRIFWASEWPMIDGAIRLSGQDYKLFMNDKGHRFWQTEEDVLYTFDVDKLKAGGKERPKPLAKELKGKELVAASTTGANYDPFNRKEGWTPISPKTTTPGGTASRSLREQFKDKKESEIQVVQLVGDIEDPFAGYLKKEKFEELAKYGCSYCQKDVEWGEKGVVVFARDDILLCPDCACVHDGATRVIVPQLPTE